MHAILFSDYLSKLNIKSPLNSNERLNLISLVENYKSRIFECVYYVVAISQLTVFLISMHIFITSDVPVHPERSGDFMK